MGCDSVGVDPYNHSCFQIADPKIYTNGPFMIGFTSSFRMGQLLGYSLVVPDQRTDESLEQFMHTTFINAVRTCFENGGFAKKENGVESGGTFLVAYRNRVFCVYDYFFMVETSLPFTACGCGSDLALGSLYSTKDFISDDPEGRLRLALGAAAEFSAGVRGPFLVLRHEGN